MRKTLSLAHKNEVRSLVQSTHALHHLQRTHTFITTPFRDRGARFRLEVRAYQGDPGIAQQENFKI